MYATLCCFLTLCVPSAFGIYAALYCLLYLLCADKLWMAVLEWH